MTKKSKLTEAPHIALRWNLQLAAREFNVHRETLEKRKRSIDMVAGDDGKYSTAQIFQLVAGDSKADEERKLTIERREKTAVEKEILLKTRIPIEEVREVMDRVLGNAAGIIKSRLDKVLSQQVIDDLFTELREMKRILK